jgi:hypothetical protein
LTIGAAVTETLGVAVVQTTRKPRLSRSLDALIAAMLRSVPSVSSSWPSSIHRNRDPARHPRR